MTNFEKELKARSKKIFEKIENLNGGIQKMQKRMNVLAKDYEQFAEDIHTEKAEKMKQMAKK